jgi:putative heme-binding domain-containing protein
MNRDLISPAIPAKRPGLKSEILRGVQCVFRAGLLLISLEVFAQLTFVGAPEPAKPVQQSPLTAEEEQATFTAPPGFNIELVAAEPDGGKFVTVAFDHAGRMWTMTAFEYPLDSNESPAEARALFARGGRDRVLVFDTPTAPGRQKPHAFAEGLVIPLGLLPYKDGAFAQYDGEIRFYRDRDGDGRADTFEPVLTGFGIEDSHLFPHQFTRAPGGWIMMAQGAFNYSKVKTEMGEVTDFNKTKLGRFTPDGKHFEIVGWGPCNIWGLVLDRFGEAFIQEANDQGWPMMPFLEGASYPLCGDDVPRPYAPPFPKLAEKEMGGTGLSGLAFSEGGDCFPGEYRDVFFIANPITGRIQAIRLHRGVETSNRSAAEPVSASTGNFGNGWRLEHLPDFIQCGDPWFRPVAIHFGPDGCLYIVDWYNKIISHNEVSRNHPERDKTRGRIWRVRHQSQPPRLSVPNLYKTPDKELLVHLGAANTWEVNAAWQEIVDRRAASLAPQLAKILMDDRRPFDLRVRALWSLEGLGKVEGKHLEKLARAPHRAVRKEALRVARNRAGQTPGLPVESLLLLGQRGLEDPDRLVRQEAIRLLCDVLDESPGQAARAPEVVALLASAAANAFAGDWPRFPDFFRDFERYLVRREFERRPALVGAWLDGDARVPPVKTGVRPEKAARLAAAPSVRAFAALAIGGPEGARRLAAIIPGLGRSPGAEELLLIASSPNVPAAKAILESNLANPAALRLFYDNRSRLTNHALLAPLLTDAIRAVVKDDPSAANLDLLVKLATGFRLWTLENELVTAATIPTATAEQRIAALRALRESGSTRVDVFRHFASSGSDAINREAVSALAATRSDSAVPALLEVWPLVPPASRKAAVDRLASSTTSARQLVSAVRSGAIARDEIDGYTLDKLASVLPEDAFVKRLVVELGSSLKPVLRLNGGDGDYVDTDISLRGPVTVECWVKLDPGISNQDSILAGLGALDANFHDGRFRVRVAGGENDIVIASKSIAPEVWAHVAFTRDAEGRFRLYLNGELDATSRAVEKRDFEHLKAGRSNVPGGTAGEFAEFRVWSVCRSPDEIRAMANVAIETSNSGPASAGSAHPGGPESMAPLLYHGAGGMWGDLHGGARIEKTPDLPPLQSESEARETEARFARYRSLANLAGDPGHGQQIFAATCAVCHSVHGQGGKIGPVLDGAGANGVEALLRNILTPNAAMEAGYRRFRVETRDGEVQEGLLVSQDDSAMTIRQPNSEDLRIPRDRVKRAGFTRVSIMPEGLLEGLKPEDAADLFAYLKALR